MVKSFGTLRNAGRAALLAFAMTTVLVALGASYPKPAAVPTRWELDFEAHDLILYVDPTDGKTYFYFTYKVTNQTGRDQLWVPKFTLFTDEGEIMPSGKDVPARVTQDLMVLLRNPFLADQNDVIGDLLQGKGNAKEGLVIWPAKNLEVNEISLFVAGISGETAKVKNPITKQDVILQKTMQRDYLIPGNAIARRGEPLTLVTEEWILR